MLNKKITYEDWRKLGCPRTPEKFLKPNDAVTSELIKTLLSDPWNPIEITEDQTYVQAENVTDVLGHTGLYQTFARPNINRPFRYAGICPKDSRRNRHPEAAELVFIVSPFADKDGERHAMNQMLATAAARYEWEHGRLPIAPHLYFPQFLEDGDELERDYGIAAGHLIMERCERVAAYIIDDYISPGMRSDIDYAANVLGISPTICSMTTAQGTSVGIYPDDIIRGVVRYGDTGRAKYRRICRL